MTTGKERPVFAWSFLFKLAVVVAALGLAGAGILFPWGVGREPLFYKWAIVVAALGLAGAGILLLLGVVREPLSYKWAVVVAALGVYAAGILLLLGVGREPLFFKWAVVVAALGVYAAGILLLWRVVREPLFFKWAAVVAALGVCAAGILLLWGVWDGAPVATAFTRVGGATRVETALEASRFWLTPPQYVVKTRTDSSQIMLGAAQCAIAHDAPLLFAAQDRKRKRRVNAIINDWRNIRKQERARKGKSVALLKVIHIKSQRGMTNCVGKRNRAYVDRLSTLEVLQLPRPQPQVRVRQTLAHVVVFAAAIKPGHLPDVAVGLALAAHIARANREKVSLVVVPHYLESDPELENMLESQHELVTGGVVLGQTPTVPEDTRALLRQLLTSRDRQGVLAQVQANLGSVGTLIAALLALFGLATAAGIGGPIVINHLERTEKPALSRMTRVEKIRTWIENRAEKKDVSTPSSPGTSEPEAKSDWIKTLGDDQEVIVWLRSGRQVTGIIEGQIPVNTPDATVFRIKNLSLVPSGPKGKHLLVSVKDIELIEFNDSK